MPEGETVHSAPGIRGSPGDTRSIAPIAGYMSPTNRYGARITLPAEPAPNRWENDVMATRRELLKGTAALPLAVVLANPGLARAAAESTQPVRLTLADGGEVGGALALPEGRGRGGILLIHEWWGLNDQIRSVAVEFARLGFVALAADLYGGKSATSPDEARSLMQAVDAGTATRTLVAWVDWLRGHERSSGKVATIGWCFGGGWSLNASIAAPADATVVYYGSVQKSVADVASLHGPVLGHFATEDQWINAQMVGGFEAAMQEAGKAVTSYWYEAQHGFANPTTARYDEEDANTAWERTVAFLGRALSAGASAAPRVASAA